ncbi:phage virion morphogenesis protein [Alicyclobacillus acidoterrestris]|uniref:phage virion morphogenesis protein n=1 Tax=Alicyclobacillus acidoterrestris TaxID=1450 RepID=UPI003F53AF71
MAVDVKPVSQIRLQFDIMGERQIDRIFTGLEEAPKDWSKPFNQMADDWFDYNRETFEQQGPGWRELAASTIKERAAKGYGPAPILVRTGLLKNSLTVRGAPQQVLNITENSMQLGTSVPYAMYHQTGNLKSDNYPMGTHPPKRQVVRLPFDMKLRDTWTNRVVHWLREQVGYMGDRR